MHQKNAAPAANRLGYPPLPCPPCSRSTVTLEVTGKDDKMRALQDVLEAYSESRFPFLLGLKLHV